MGYVVRSVSWSGIMQLRNSLAQRDSETSCVQVAFMRILRNYWRKAVKTEDVRRDNLRKLMQEHGASALSRKLGYKHPSFLTQLAGPNPSRRITEDSARRYERDLGLPSGWLDNAAPAATTTTEGSTALVATVIRLVGAVLQGEKIDVQPARFADLVALAYVDAAEHGGAPREAHVRSLVRLMKA